MRLPGFWYRIRPYIRGDLVADLRYERRADGFEYVLPGPVRRVRRRLWR